MIHTSMQTISVYTVVSMPTTFAKVTVEIKGAHFF